MSKRFGYRDDDYIVQYQGVVTDGQLALDLGRSEASIKARAKKLRESGAWCALQKIRGAQREYLACMGFDEIDQAIGTLAR